MFSLQQAQFLALMLIQLIGIAMSIPFLLYEQRNPRPKGKPLEPQRITLMRLALTGVMLCLLANGASYLTMRS